MINKIFGAGGVLLKKFVGSRNDRILKSVQPIVHRINALEAQMKSLSDEALGGKTAEFKDRLASGAALDDILPEAFAVVREAGRRTINMRHFDCQLVGGVSLHRGMIAEMATGEGKTLVATLPIYLNALTGKGVHLVTVNDYLAKRDRNWMGPIYESLGLSVGVIQHDMPQAERQAAYRADITYGTNNEYGFDYLRDNMVADLQDRVQRKLHYSIVDEVDSILIDEARTPLIISGPAEESTDKYYRAKRAADIMKGLRVATESETKEKSKSELITENRDMDYIAEEKSHTITLTETGEERAAKIMGVENLHDMTTVEERHHVIAALRAKEFYKRDVEYLVKDGKVIIVDEFTGRLMPGRRWSDGLHQAVEAKEGLTIERENQTLATITFQNYFRMYEKLAGMTGTAATEAAEFDKIYKLDVLVIPTNKACIRMDNADRIYRTEKEKFKAVADEISQLHKEGRPVLVGTISIEKSEHLSHILEKRALPHTVLNAKYHEKEAEIVARAGQEAAITIATNMAGRGTDIVLGSGIAQKGGLHVLGTERHEARRIDNQLRGRCGRQGDPGSSRFYLSLEDDLMRIFGSDRISGLMERLGMEEGQEIEHGLVTRAVETAQKRVEGRNFEIRKHLLEYDDVMNRQREIIYEERDRVLESESLTDHILEMIENVIDDMIAQYVNPEIRDEERDEEGFKHAFHSKFGISLKEAYFTKNAFEEWREDLMNQVKEAYKARTEKFGADRMHFLERYLMLQVIDGKWKEHLRAIDELREGIHLRAYGQRDPLVEYKQESFGMFEQMTASIKDEVVEFLFKVQAVREEERVTTVMSPAKQQFLHPEAERMPALQDAGSRFGSEPGERGNDPSVDRGIGAPPRQADPSQRLQPIRREQPKVGRNEPCPCGSGKKYKKCHGQ
ncbi:MAG: preprotein translocase subunit SecA [Candidatus Omnitrophica bacterium]|nr:preprotein translocase subunit SecA [Candidatus Omnitrophota bacterium]